mmetsp:Transcript_1794/g.5638  ORF Transcript_1794/g.5638 Transcript_1794/m.5638 type:complete len:234 (+) Transcript_1794:822-1523(+)
MLLILLLLSAGHLAHPGSHAANEPVGCLGTTCTANQYHCCLASTAAAALAAVDRGHRPGLSTLHDKAWFWLRHGELCGHDCPCEDASAPEHAMPLTTEVLVRPRAPVVQRTQRLAHRESRPPSPICRRLRCPQQRLHRPSGPPSILLGPLPLWPLTRFPSSPSRSRGPSRRAPRSHRSLILVILGRLTRLLTLLGLLLPSRREALVELSLGALNVGELLLPLPPRTDEAGRVG